MPWQMPRSPQEHSLDEQHELIAALERVVELYAQRKRTDTRPAQQVRRILALEQERREMMRRNLARTRSRS